MARVYKPDDVGVATTLISATSFIAYLSLMGFNEMIVRFVAGSTNPRSLITQSLAVVAVSGLLLSALYVVSAPWYAPAVSFVRDNRVFAAGFVITGALAGINLFADDVFIGFRRPEYNLFIDGFVQSVTKLVLPAAFVGLGAFRSMRLPPPDILWRWCSACCSCGARLTSDSSSTVGRR